MEDCKKESPLTSEYVDGLLAKKRAAPAEVVRALVGAVQRGDKGFASGAKKPAVSTRASKTVVEDANDQEGD